MKMLLLLLVNTNIYWQCPFVQAFLSVTEPEQGRPPCRGDGLLHSRDRVWVPVPHVTLHTLHLLRRLQSPSTIGGEYEMGSLT